MTEPPPARLLLRLLRPPSAGTLPPRSSGPPPAPLLCVKSKPALSRWLDDAASATIPSPEWLRSRCSSASAPYRSGAAAMPKPPENPKQSGLVANSVALTVPHSKLVDPKRGRTEVLDGFSAVSSPDSSQESENAYENITTLLRGKDIEIMELEKKLKSSFLTVCSRFQVRSKDNQAERLTDKTKDSLLPSLAIETTLEGEYL
ncbi:hypothetical protein ABZP36_010020 [Zizania latifolia]